MQISSKFAIATAALLSALIAAPQVNAQTTSRGAELIAADKGRVTGQIVVDFGSRKLTSATGVDVYTISNLTAADLMVLNGTINRTPEKSLGYSVKFDLFNPKNPSQVAKEAAILRGDVLIDQSGRYDPVSGKLRIDVVKGTQSTAAFRGGLQGREVTRWWEVSEQLKKAQKAAAKEYSRVVEGKTIVIQVKNADPLRFRRPRARDRPFLVSTRDDGARQPRLRLRARQLAAR